MSPPAPELACTPIEPGTLVIADLHLDVGSHGGEHTAVIELLRTLHSAPRLIVLGDLFDAWIGPAQMELASAARVVGALRELVASGTQVDLLHGNRDFLLEGRFELRTGARVHPHGLIGECAGQRVLFVHGDELCTLDLGYQRMKRVLRSRPVTWSVARLPAPLALALARRLRKRSVSAVGAKAAYVVAQQPDEAGRLAREQDCTTLVCGHAHVFQDQRLPGGARWIVLGALGSGNDLLRFAAGGRIELSTSGLRVDPKP